VSDDDVYTIYINRIEVFKIIIIYVIFYKIYR
jgi:hypothetical protein